AVQIGLGRDGQIRRRSAGPAEISWCTGLVHWKRDSISASPPNAIRESPIYSPLHFGSQPVYVGATRHTVPRQPPPPPPPPLPRRPRARDAGGFAVVPDGHRRDLLPQGW